MDQRSKKLNTEVNTITLRNVPDGLKAKLAAKAESEGKRLVGRKMPLGAFVIKILNDYIKATS